MRPKERIPIFLELIDWGNLLNKRWNLKLNIDNNIFNILYKDKWDIEYWKNNTDQRIGQILINLGLIQNELHIWIDEEEDILYDQGIHPREFLFWTSLFDKEGNKLKEPTTKLIRELDTNHIKNILKSKLLHLNDLYVETFNNELKLRHENMDN